MANMFYDSLSANNYFVYVARTVPFDGNGVEEPGDSLNDTFLELNERMIFGKHITDDDTRIMIKNKSWTPGQVYPIYDDLNDNLDDQNFYVVTRDGDEVSVFKCIDNDNDAVSLVKPIRSETSPNDNFYRTSDNYVWKLMYTVSGNSFDKFATSKYFPIEVDADIANNAIAGGIECVRVEVAGAGYDNFIEGSISQINIGGNPRKMYIQGESGELASPTGYYTNSAIYITSGNAQGQLRSITSYGVENNRRFITVDASFSPAIAATDTFEISPNVIVTGDGTGFQGRAVINETSGTIERVEIIDRGTGYTQATATIVANTAGFDTNAFSAGSARPIISPIGGHGSDPQKELYGHLVGVSVDFAGNELPTANNDYRSFGIMKDPTFKDAQIQLNTSVGLNENDVIIQSNTNATGTITDIDVANNVITLGTVTGVFNATDTISVGNTEFTVSSILDNNDTFDQRLVLDTSLTFGAGFQKDETIIQQNTNASAVVHQYDSGTIRVINVQGNFLVSTTSVIVGQTSGTRAVINTITQPDMIKGSGEAMFVQNIEPITRADGRTERTKIIIGF